MSTAPRSRSYYEELRDRADIGQIAGELLAGRASGESSGSLTFNCPGHASESGTSLHVDPHWQRWKCWAGCGHGDVIDLVEFVNAGVVTSGTASTTHREARDWLASHVGIEPLSKFGLSAEKLAAIEITERERARVFGCLTAMAEIQHARLFDPKAGDGIQRLRDSMLARYGIKEETARALLIGLGSDEDFRKLRDRGFDSKTILSTGAFYEPSVTFLAGRIVFPYWSSGRVVYAIGRKTGITLPSRGKGKYWKLLVRGKDGRYAFVSEHVRNDNLFGEDILRTNPETVVLTEGITDAIAGQQAGFAVLSQVTARITDRDIQRTAPKLAKAKRVVVIQDNEVSGIGLRAALLNARIFGEHGVEALVAKIPLDPEQERARAELGSMLGGVGRLADLEEAKPGEQGKLLEEWVESEELGKAKDLRERAKTDLAEWMRKRGPEDLGRLIASARHPIEFAIEHAPSPRPGSDDGLLPAEGPLDPLADVLDEIARLDSSSRGKFVDLIKAKTKVTKKEIEATVKDRAKSVDADKKRTAESAGAREDARKEVLSIRSDTCRQFVDEAIQVYRRREMGIDWKVLGEGVFHWFDDAGAAFFYNRDNETVQMFWNGSIVTVATSSTEFVRIMFAAAGIAGVSTNDRELLSSFRLIAANEGRGRSLPFSWNETLDGGRKLYVSTGGETAVMIDEEGVHVTKNGANDDGVVLVSPTQFDPIAIDPDADPSDLDVDLDVLVGKYLACRPRLIRFVLDFIASIPMIAYVGTRPLLRFQGVASSGKSFGAKMITTLIGGSDRNIEATVPALWSVAATDPLVSIDNVEGAEVERDAFRQFLLTSATKASRMKRRGGTDTGVVSEISNAFVLMSGIESFGGGLREIASRSFVIPFSPDFHGDDPVLEDRVLAAIAADRDRIWSMIYARIAIVLDLINRSNARERVHVAISKALGKRHGKARLNEYLTLIYLHRVAAAPEEARDAMLDVIDADFKATVLGLVSIGDQTEQESSPIAGALEALFAWLGENREGLLGVKKEIDRDRISDVTGRHLFNALSKIRRDVGIPFPFRDAKHLGERMMESRGILAEVGIRVDAKRDRRKTNRYTIEFNPSDATPTELPLFSGGTEGGEGEEGGASDPFVEGLDPQ